MVLPIVASIVREVFSQTPVGEKEAALALGATRWGMVRTVVLPFGKGGIIGGSMLGLGRALGETIAVALLLPQVPQLSARILQNGGSTIAGFIAGRAGSDPFTTSGLMAAGLVLFVMTLVTNMLASIVVSRSRSGAGVGAPSLRLGFFLHDQRGISPLQPATSGGGLHAIVGTLEEVGLAVVVALPLGALAALFLHESRSRWRRPVRIFVDAMSGLPSIIAGLFTEGVEPVQTAKGPGHVPGTAGLGQPGNAGVVARRSAFGGPFSGLNSLRPGDSIVVTTTEGQSLYLVSQVRSVTLTTGTTTSTPAVGVAQTPTSPTAPTRLGASISVDNLYGASTTNRLTLVTSDSLAPWNTVGATVVVATMKTAPFTPTPQQSRSTREDGRSSAPGSWAPAVLALLAFGLVAWGAVFIYRRGTVRTAYLISTAPLVVATVLLAVALSRLLPAWD